MIQCEILEPHDNYIANKYTNEKFHYDNPQEMRILTDHINKLINENSDLTDDYKSLMLTKDLIREKLMDYQRIATKFNLISSTELEWLLDKVFEEKPELKDEISIKHALKYYKGI